MLSVIAFSASAANAAMPRVEFSMAAPQVDGTNISLTRREQDRIERFLAHVFPIRQMRREAGCWKSPESRHVTYSLISQEGLRFVLAGYNAEWRENDQYIKSVNTIAIYRMDSDGPNQVWRGRPWMASYDGLRFSSAKANDKSHTGRNIVLFQEGGSSGKFGLASVFSFRNKESGLVIRDITPMLPCLRASTRFPFRPLYGRQIGLRANVGDAHDLILTANDEQFKISQNDNQDWRPDRRWRYKRGRFEPWNLRSSIMSSEMGDKN